MFNVNNWLSKRFVKRTRPKFDSHVLKQIIDEK